MTGEISSRNERTIEVAGKQLGVFRSGLARVGAWALQKSIGGGFWNPYGQSLPTGYPMNWWQKGLNAPSEAEAYYHGPVFSSVNIISQDGAKIPVSHVKYNPDGSFEKVITSAAHRVLRRPNPYQNRMDYIQYILRSLLSDGNAYSLAVRNDRQEVEALYPLNPRIVYPYITPDGGVIYAVGQDPTREITAVDPSTSWFPSRDILHMRLQTPVHPLIGESPIKCALYPAMAGMEINKHSASFFHNMSRPSGVLRHPGKLEESAMKRIKERWKEISTHENTGEPAVLAEGMEWQQMQMTAVDAELAATYQLTERNILQVFRIPPFLAGDSDKSNLTNVESLTRFYLQTCLGYYISYMEAALADFFRMDDDNVVFFDVEAAILRGDLKERMEAYSKGIQNAVYAPNEARKKERLPPVEDGDEPRVQQQLVPLSYGKNLQPPQSAGPGRPSTTSPDEPSDTPSEDEPAVSEQRIYLAYSQLKKAIKQ